VCIGHLVAAATRSTCLPGPWSTSSPPVYGQVWYAQPAVVRQLPQHLPCVRACFVCVSQQPDSCVQAAPSPADKKFLCNYCRGDSMQYAGIIVKHELCHAQVHPACGVCVC
jgi:hypothetical protein